MNKKKLNESFQRSVQKILPELKFNEIRVAKSLREAEGDGDIGSDSGTQVSRGKIKKLPTGRFKAKNKEGDTALFSTEKEALQYATASSEEAWNAKFGPQSKKKNESAEDVDDDLAEEDLEEKEALAKE